jgi:hydrogenase 3 maturation protease
MAMHAIEKKLTPLIKGKVLVIGAGNSLKGDDGLGCVLSETLKKYGNIDVLDAGVSIENYLGTIIKKKPDTIIIVDAVHFDAPAGTIDIFEQPDFPVTHFSTHGMSLQFFFDMLHNEGITNIILIGIQPESMDMGAEMSEPVKKAIVRLENVLRRVLELQEQPRI